VALVRRDHLGLVEHLGTVFGEVAEGTRERLKADAMREAQAQLLFAYWQAKLDHKSALLDRKRLARLVARLKENAGNVNELLYVVDGTLKDDHLMGREGGKAYDGIETLFRDRGQVERLSVQGGYVPGKVHPMVRKYPGANPT
jgi:hypothetical protein